MRMMIRVRIPVETGNKAVHDGSLPKSVSEALERLKPEAAYFFPDQGMRSMLMITDVNDSSEIPAIAELFFSRFNAAVEIFPVMNADDLKKGLAKIM